MTDSLCESVIFERIELIARMVADDHCVSRDRQIALIWIAELSEDARRNMLERGNIPPVSGGDISGCGTLQ
ncbi:hypothetical protein EGX44_17960 [Yersinia pseudotuberculosis]|nr:hypothetical protein EGX44_17960 [Yersinia pseudotuberculosis]PNM20045.1 hypothetical protein A6J65_015080 [Yersinia enterocolitica]